MPPPRAPAKRDAPATPTSSPSTPSAAPGTPAESVEEPRKKKQRRAEEQTPLTAVQKARDQVAQKEERRGNPDTDTPNFALCRSIEQRDGEVRYAV